MPGFAILLVSLLLATVPEPAQRPNTSVRESTAVATVERIERSSRVLTLRDKDNATQTVYVGPEVTAFQDLKVGDLVTVRYIESVIAEVRPNAKLAPTQDTTQQARKAGDKDVVEQWKAVVRIESIDSQRLVVTYRTHDNRIITHAVQDKALLEGIRPGDRVEITLTRARAVSIERTRR